ncbi:ORF6N domain-containing protein [Acinetobacter johnsonii]|uniref:ORF6N domain-containing protein n=1 Tax=Acinetobacter johnsonii TaxID=40214 RepID=UPI000F67DB61|nr:ORF6N domain-containing protein [Acinetobacter johnsonii]QYA56407.1 ORF6N domain-containing protein [Acinetobacter johnsonii]
MTNIAQINNTQVSIVNFKSIPVITTEMMADFYGTESKNIQNNFLRNSKRFIEGKHFFKIIGQELKDFKNQPSLRGLVNKRVSHLTLWTERGAARHAKMLDTDQAWDIFEQLEDCYFRRQEILAKTHKSERTPLHDAHAMLVAKTKHLNSSDAWKIINQRFGTEHIEDIPYEAIPVAVEYVHHLIAIYSSAEKKQFSEGDLHNLHALATHMIWARSWWQDFGDMIKKLNPVIYSRATTHFVDGSSLAWQFVRADTKQELKECVNNFNWLTGTYQQKLPI